MTSPTITERERTVLRTLIELSTERDERETSISGRYKSDRAAAEREIEERLREIEERYNRQKSTAEDEYQSAREEATVRHRRDYKKTKQEYESERFRVGEQADHDEAQTRKKWEEARWTAETVYEAKEKQPKKTYDRNIESLQQKKGLLTSLERQAAEALRRSWMGGVARAADQSEAPGESTPTEGPDEYDRAAQELDERCTAATDQLHRLRRQFSRRLYEGGRPLLIPLFVLAAAASGLGWMTEWRFDRLFAEFAIGAGAVSLVLLVVLYILARKGAGREYAALKRAVHSAHDLRRRCRDLAAAKRAREERQLIAERDEELQAADDKYGPRLEKIRQLRDQLIQELDEKYTRLLANIKERRTRELADIDQRHESRMGDLETKYKLDRETAQRDHEARRQEIEETFQSDWEQLERRWREGMAWIHSEVEQINSLDRQLFPPWSDEQWRQWSPPTSFAPGVHYGEHDVNLKRIPGGIPRDERLLDVGPMEFTLPAVLDFPRRSSLLIETADGGRERGVATLQNVMLRLLTAFPPGKVRFTIVDPVGLGQNFAGFMHLADYEEAFVADRIWTETRHIEQRLLDLTEHMENVIQKYLRNDFETITEYNVHAGEIAEPFRFLVIANFPVNFSESAARRLTSIIDSGARCGVYTLISVDTRQQMPQGLQVDDLRKGGVVLAMNGEEVTCRDEDFAHVPLELESPPPPEFITETLRVVGESAKDSSRVEVPFKHVIPTRDQYWSRSCDTELTVPLGRAGATKLQMLSLGRGISQHVLIAGKTGSGKSTLLHVLVTNLAVHYHPDEVEFYLVDFKKGVEFKTYATYDLPHAKVVAIESDREFGLSVLHRVDDELKRRGELFRKLGVQDIAGYRRTDHPERMPRTLLVIDEFQEFFVEDDKLAQDAALLLDRLVRQGRAFGIHVLLGSQTLAGAYSLARSTIGQMAVRVALQCSEADAMLIMHDDNTAARLLSRPGEAIYNDQSGALEGNSPFQIVWLPEEVRDKHLGEIESLVQETGYRRHEPLIVFEGNVPADVRRNDRLRETLDAAESEVAPAAPVAWLGDAIAIKEPTAAALRRQSGCNVMMVGQRDEAALAMQAVSMVSLAAQTSADITDGARFYVLDGAPADHPNAGYMQTVARALPHDVQVVGWHDVEAAMNELGEELDRRQTGNVTQAPPIYLFIYGLQRFRMLRQEEDFGFSSPSEEPQTISPDKHFGNVLRDGPPYGLHTIVWCDTYNNLSRALDRKAVREFDMRVLFQMSSADSSSLLDSPMASMLGQQRAIFFSEDHGILEKFRPYALPDDNWLKEVAETLRRKTADMT